MHHPTRGGTRGGQGLFKWEDVKEDKYRENYLGHSLNAPVGRWQKNKDLLWYGKEEDKGRASDDVLSAELEEIKRNEAEALAEALGYAGPKRRRADPNAVSKQEIQSLVKKDFAEDEETAVPIVDEMKGLGFQSTKSRIAAVGLDHIKEPTSADALHNPTSTAVKREPTSSSITDFGRYEKKDTAEKKHKKEKKKEKKDKREKGKKDKKEKKRMKKELKEEEHSDADMYRASYREREREHTPDRRGTHQLNSSPVKMEDGRFRSVSRDNRIGGYDGRSNRSRSPRRGVDRYRYRSRSRERRSNSYDRRDLSRSRSPVRWEDRYRHRDRSRDWSPAPAAHHNRRR